MAKSKKTLRSKNQGAGALGPEDLSRRDFLNGALLASGGLVVSQSFPLRAFAAALKRENACDGPIGSDRRALRGGNLPSTFMITHWMRDRRLSFEKDHVILTPGCDSHAGKFGILDDVENFDVVVSGGGIAGLSTAFYIWRRQPHARILIIDANNHVGGNAGRDDQAPLPTIAATGGSYSVAPYDSYLKELYSGVGLEWEKYRITAPMYSYYCDDRTPGIKKGHRGWNKDSYGGGIKDLPYSPEVVQQLLKCKADFQAWGQKMGGPTDPADSSDPKYDYLAKMTLHDYLIKVLKCDPVVSDFYTRYTIDALGGTTEHVNAHSGISFLQAEYGDLFALPGGTSGLVRHLVHTLIKGSINGHGSAELLSHPMQLSMLDHSDHPVKLRQNAVVLRADQGTKTSGGASVVYYKDGKFRRAKAKAVVLAGQAHTAQHLVEHLTDEKRKAAWKKTKMVPVVVANVVLKNAESLVEAGLGYNQYWWGSKYWADFVTADWTTPKRNQRNRSTVLTFFGGNTAPPGELAAERAKLIYTPFGDYEKSIKDDLSRIMSRTKFDFDRDVSAICVYRWGHGMIMPTTDSVFEGPRRELSARHISRAQLGRISFAGQDTEGTPSAESAMASGFRAATEVLALL